MKCQFKLLRMAVALICSKYPQGRWWREEGSLVPKHQLEMQRHHTPYFLGAYGQKKREGRQAGTNDV